jgi:hypothetical protein
MTNNRTATVWKDDIGTFTIELKVEGKIDEGYLSTEVPKERLTEVIWLWIEKGTL